MTPGARLGVYDVTAQLGEGGMGAVYRARDTKLQRDVALKVLLPEVANDPERLARFRREAQTLAALNHPHIGAIYGLEESAPSAGAGQASTIALVLELVEGPTLADRIARGPIPVDEALPIARQIAEALEAAHEQGIIHRDLKPANIKVKDDGTVKVLDFGLAKAMEPAAGSRQSATGIANSPTITSPAMTQAGMILGTAAYMAPEQARGKAVDRRADIWAFGAVLFEMLSGRRPFEGEDMTEVLGAVVRLEPPWDALPLPVPARVTQALRLCLRKDPKQRVGDIRDVRLALEGAFETAAPRPATAVGRSTLAAAAAGLVAVGAAVGVALGVGVFAPAPPTPAVRRLPLDMQPITGRVELDLSRDGRHLVFAANDRLFLRSMDEADARPISGTEGARHPFFSPDGQRVAFWAEGQVRTVPVSGSVPFVVAEFREIQSGWWGDGGQIFFGVSRSGPIYRVSDTGGTPEVFAELDAYQDLDWPIVLPGGDWVLFSGEKPGGEQEIVAQSVSTGARRVVLSGGKFARYAASGHLVFFRDSRLWAVGFNADRLEVTGAPVPLVDRVQGFNAGVAFSPVSFRLADDGSLVYVEDSQSAGLFTLALVDRDTGTVEDLGVAPADYTNPRVAPDGR